MLVDTLTNGNETLEIHVDTDPLNPRTEYENFGKLVCFHSRYTLGDQHDLSLEYAQRIEENRSDKYIVLPVYMYDHSGLTISSTPFSCPWDSGQIGIIYVSKEKVRNEYGWKVITKKRKEQIIKNLESELTTYDHYLTGSVYGYKKFVNGEEEDSCWGFFGDDHIDSGLFDCAQWKYEPKTNKEKLLEKLGK